MDASTFLFDFAPRYLNMNATAAGSGNVTATATTNANGNGVTVLDVFDYVKTATKQMLDCHDRRIPASLRDLYKKMILDGDRENCRYFSIVIDQLNRSFTRLYFMRDSLLICSGFACAKIPRLIPFDRGVRKIEITISDAFNDMQYRLRNKCTVELSDSIENPYVKFAQNVLIAVMGEYCGHPLERSLFSSRASFDETDTSFLRSFDVKASTSATPLPTQAPTQTPTPLPTQAPTQTPTPPPTPAPTQTPTQTPTPPPTQTPTQTPMHAPTPPPTQTPTQTPMHAPTPPPTQTPMHAPTPPPTQTPTQASTQALTQASTQALTQASTQAPTPPPTQAPTPPPTQAPTPPPTQAPTPPPTQARAKRKISSPTLSPPPKWIAQKQSVNHDDDDDDDDDATSIDSFVFDEPVGDDNSIDGSFDASRRFDDDDSDFDESEYDD